MDFKDGHRKPRPTFRALREIPQETIDNKVQRGQVRAFLQDPKRDVYLYGLDQPLMRDGERYFPDNFPDPHTESSKAAQRRVYELRDPSGAGMRAAVILDDGGDPWVVYVEKHDKFHKNAPAVLSASVSHKTGRSPLQGRLPTTLDYKVRAREEAALQERQWQRDVLGQMIVGIATALETPGGLDVELQSRSGSYDGSRVHVEFGGHEPPAIDDQTSGLESSHCYLEMELKVASSNKLPLEAVISKLLPFLQGDVTSREANYDIYNNLVIWVAVSHAKVAQLKAAADFDEPHTGIPDSPVAPSHLHYVLRESLTQAVVEGGPMRSLCGCWFVPTQDEGCDLPVCLECEAAKPTAQRVTDMIRTLLSVE